MVNVGVFGFGFMGRMHFGCYKGRDDVRITAICEADAKQLRDGGGAGGNVPGADAPLDLEGVGLFSDFDAMLEEAELDALSITLPTYLHADFSCRALERGIHVLCEKPMALSLAECDRMVAAAASSGKHLQIGHCIRFWPEYAKAKELLDGGAHGKLLAVSLRRLSAKPAWSHENWLMNAGRSGGMELDLHIHDTDFLQYLLGVPQAVYTRGAPDPGGGLGHVMTQYIYEENIAVFAEGGWLFSPGFGFEMSFNMVLEEATIVFDSTRDPAFRVCPAEGGPYTPDVAEGDGYTRQIDHFLRAVRGEPLDEVATVAGSRDSIRIVEAEKRSAASGVITAVD